jgi:hemin uptake protein HemP
MIATDRLTSRASRDADPALPAGAEAKAPIRRVAVSDILGGRREAILLHAGEEYRLRITRNAKLILTK